jgi:succinoglycan biosynthesis protein ExoM
MSQNKRKKNDDIICSVCIATYKRPLLLDRLLQSLKRQNLPEYVKLEIIVVDNDFESSAKCIVDKFQNMPQISFHYFTEPVKNISIVRNKSVKKSSGQYLLFIDDDEFACSRWVYYLLTTLEKFSADGVFGPVLPEINAHSPKWMKYICFNPVSQTGVRAHSKWTGNCIIKASLLKTTKAPFDPQYGISGGEDSHLFDILEKQGAQFIYCKEARVYEFWPSDRTTLFYLFSRGLRGGNLHTLRNIEFSVNRKIIVRMFMLMKAVSFGPICLLLMVILYPSSKYRTLWLIRLGSNIGRFFAVFGWRNRGYR